jgi:hypothetical protein
MYTGRVCFLGLIVTGWAFDLSFYASLVFCRWPERDLTAFYDGKGKRLERSSGITP